MSAENLIAFQARVVADVDLQQKVAAIHQNAARELAEKIAALSQEVGTPFTAEEFLAPQGLTDDELDGVVGGFFGAAAPLSPAEKLANAAAIAQLRASNILGNDSPKVAY